jgi:hypothetical protein
VANVVSIGRIYLAEEVTQPEDDGQATRMAQQFDAFIRSAGYSKGKSGTEADDKTSRWPDIRNMV